MDEKWGIEMKKVRVEDAVGMVLAHDLTKIVPGEFKGAAFKKGHIIKLEDVRTLKDMGKYHINILELDTGEIHENDAALRISRAIAGKGIYLKGPSEGKIELRAAVRGIVKIRVEALNRINEIEDVTVATIHNNTLVERDQILASARIIPLTIDGSKIDRVEDIGSEFGSRIVEVRDIKPLRTGVVVVGTEVYEGRIRDRFAAAMEKKLRFYGCPIIGVEYAPDDVDIIEGKIRSFLEMGAELILACGGMSVDADDLTPQAIKQASDRVVTYGVPSMPGNMLMLAYSGNTAVFGIPGAGMHHRIISLDLLLPRIMAGEVLTPRDIISYGHGGLCLGCKDCRFPACPYGK